MKNKAKYLFQSSFLFFCLILLISGCNLKEKRDQKLATEIAVISTEIQSTLQAAQTQTVASIPTDTPLPTFTPTPPATETPTPTVEFLPTATATPDVRPSADEWANWPILPTLSENAKKIFWHGVNDLKTNPKVFSKIGDCQSRPNVFLGIYDMGYEGILADEDLYLQAAIDYYKGSFLMESYAVHDGMNVGSVLTTTWADPKACHKDENALECEIRIHNPSIMFVNLGTNWVSGVSTDAYYDYLAEIVQVLIDHGILPILSSKADNVEGDNSINRITAQVARDFDVPFFNFWLAAQSLENHGLSKEKPIYLSVSAWDYRNYYALKLLYNFGNELGLF
jgi:hypothetical protein